MLLIPYDNNKVSSNEIHFFNEPYLNFLANKKNTVLKQLLETEILYESSLASEEFKFLKPLKTKIRFLKTTLEIIDTHYQYDAAVAQLMLRIKEQQDRINKIQTKFDRVVHVRKKINE